MSSTRRKPSNKGKRKFYSCYHFEFEYDDLGKYRWCHSKESGCRECRCENIFQMNACPHFKKTGNGYFLKMDKHDKASVEKFLSELKAEHDKLEVDERALLKYLKAKYEH